MARIPNSEHARVQRDEMRGLSVIEARGISKSYSKGGNAALSSVSVTFGNRGLVAICGPAACGKTTLLNILGGIERPDSGDLLVDGKQMRGYREGDLNGYRNARVGFVFQNPVFVGHRTVLENVELAPTIAGLGYSERRDRALEALRLLGVEDCASKKPGELSGAQQRLVETARALAKDPDILLADDPTCGLDKSSAETVMSALKHAAQSRLVVMATSDEELAERYASRIICLAGGEVASNEVVGAGVGAEQAAEGPVQLSGEANADSGTSAKSRRSMPFSTAMSYSIRNIFAKKGRAILTVLASAISMIGIAAIVALGGGANNFIANLEEASIATDPLVIGKSGLDLTGLLGSDSMKNLRSQSAAGGEQSNAPGTARVNTLEGSIQNMSSMLSETISHIRDNDLVAFKQYVDANSDGILNCVDTVQYDYGVAPLIYNGDMSHGVEKLNPSALSDMLTRRANSTASTINEFGRFNEIVNDQGILDEQMDLVYGTWPKSFDECVIVLDGNGGISDLTLYYMGIYDHEAVERAQEAALSGESIELPDSPSELSYEQLANSSFVVLPRVSLYQKNAERGTWADKSNDDDYVAEKIATEGIRLRVSGIVQPKQGVISPLMSEGVGYTSELANRLIEISAQSEITQQQIANPTVDVFTGKTFEDLKAHPAGNLDLENIITVNEQAIARILSMFEGEEEADSGEDDLEVLWADLSKIDWSQFEINERDVLDAMNAQRVYDAIALASMLDPEAAGLQLTEKQQAEVSALTGEMVANFTAYAVGEGATAENLHNSNRVGRYWKEYLKTDEGKRRMTELDLLVGQSYGDVVRGQLEEYLTTVYAEVIIDEAAADIIEQALGEVAKELEKELERALPVIADRLGKELEAAIISELDRILVEVEQGATAVANELENVIQINMTEEDLVAYLNNLTDSSEIGYDNNMAKLGYADMSQPLSMSIYPKDLPAKQEVVQIIANYNDRMEKAGMSDRTIIYNNTSGEVSEALSAVVDVVGLALIALISITLVVGSIMMVIITCTGIAERRREMGLLRALGASRGDLVTMFNAETLLEGLLAGAIAVGVVFAVSAAVNNMVAASSGGADVMVLPPEVAAGLVALSGALPLLAGLVPSLVMSRKNPAQSLRS
ncbi:MAG TPA: hypothetical protein DCP91_05950 [Eggerthellaceae bacterium]|nr:hypothetical protein [Eggerthellaceae bacterium]